MNRLIYCAFIIALVTVGHFGLDSDDTTPINFKFEEDNEDVDIGDDLGSDVSPADNEHTTTVHLIIENMIENMVENGNGSITESITTTSTTTILTTTVVNEKPEKQFLTKYSLNANLSSLLLSDLILHRYLNELIILVFENHEILLVNKTDGVIKHYFQYAHVIPINQQLKQSELVVIFDDNTHELWLLNSTHEQKSIISFKPKQIYIFPSANNLWIAETTDEVALYTSRNSGIEWVQINESSSSSVLGWSDKANAVVIVQHSHFVKLLNVEDHKIKPVLSDVSSAKLFSHYLLAKQTQNLTVISHVNNLAHEDFRSLPKRFQSQGNFYCAFEDVNTQDLLLLFITDNKVDENNQTILSTCNLISYSKRNLFNLPNINCESINIDNILNDIQCSSEKIPFYQVRGLPRTGFLANIGTEKTTVVSFDGGVTWNKTHYECDKTINCPKNPSIVMSSIISSNDIPGVLVGKATDGSNEYVAVSSNGGRLWRLSLKGQNQNYLTAFSNPNALIVALPKTKELSKDHSFRYSTDYGHNWHQGKIANDTSFQILNLVADNNNIFYILTLHNENQLNLTQLDFNLLIRTPCARYQLKQWSLHGICANGSKFYYTRRTSGSHCLDNASQIHTEPCACSLSDFKCSPGYKRSKDGICLPKSHYILSQDCSCHENSSLLTRHRGYVKLDESRCDNGIEDYLSNVDVMRRGPNHPNLLLYGLSSRSSHAVVEIHSNDFGQDDDDEEKDEDDGNDEASKQSVSWLVEEKDEITALVFDESTKQAYMAVNNGQTSSIYRFAKNLHQPSRTTKRLTFDANNVLYKSTDEIIEYMAIDRQAQNLYILVRNKNNLQNSIIVFSIRTYKKRTIVQNQQISPSMLVVDSVKPNLYWISHESPSKLNIANLQGQVKKQIQLLPTDSNITYISYDPITHEIIFVSDSTIYGFNTLDYRRQDHVLSRVIYEHSSVIQNSLFVHPMLYFTQENNDIENSVTYLHSIDILGKSYAKNVAKLKNFKSLKLFVDMTPIVPLSSTTTTNPCASNPCFDLCIPLEHGRFRCLCGDDARYQTCSCPSDEKLSEGSCLAKNGQCAPGRILCQNRQNCAESANICEQDHTHYNETFKTIAMCTIDKPNDGFDCYYTGTDLTNAQSTCIPIEWLCDGAYDCPLGNDEAHCNKMTTTAKPVKKVPGRCLTDNKFTHVMCGDKCTKINDLCRDVSNALSCSDQFHLNCKQTQDQNQYACKCSDNKDRCIAMIESCDDFEHCERICNDSIHYATKKSFKFDPATTSIWMILIVAIGIILVITIIIITIRYCRRLKAATSSSPQSRTPVETGITTNNSASNDAREQLLNQATNEAKETS